MRAMKNPDYDAWLINGADDPKGTVYEDERYETIKKWLELSDEEMEEIDLDEKWDAYLDYQAELEAEYRAERQAEAMIERMESRADDY